MKLPLRSVKPVRREDVPTQPHYRKYKELLKEDFSSCCGYCGIHHVYFGSGLAFHIDHFAPKSIFKKLENDYKNLVYSCPFCNMAKSNDWPGGDSAPIDDNGIGYIDPCSPEYEHVFYRDCSGSIRYSENHIAASYMYRKLKFGLTRHRIFWMADYLSNLATDLEREIEKIPDESSLKSELNNQLLGILKLSNKYKNIQREL